MLDGANMRGLRFQAAAAIDQLPTCHRVAAIIGVHHGTAECAVTEWLLILSEKKPRRGKLIRCRSIFPPKACECSANVSAGRVETRRLI